MVSSYLLSSSLVPVLSTWLMRHKHGAQEGRGCSNDSDPSMAPIWFCRPVPLASRWIVCGGVGGAPVPLLVPRLGTEFFPRVDTGAFRIRLRAPIGTRVERTEVMTLKALDVIRHEVGPENVEISHRLCRDNPTQLSNQLDLSFYQRPARSCTASSAKAGSPIRVRDFRSDCARSFMRHCRILLFPLKPVTSSARS